jgi:hypothetical protein
MYRRLGGPQGRFRRVRKFLPPPGFDPRTIQAVASRYNAAHIGRGALPYIRPVLPHIHHSFGTQLLVPQISIVSVKYCNYEFH